ncbi:QsdR family transcriptional regulator [Paenarthrobacter aurescens]|uniref:QsdR family transcriptional regulator n=1 Tax=Paenarthrobacter aurescens TaxID=43663 RepID=UPI0035E781A7
MPQSGLGGQLRECARGWFNSLFKAECVRKPRTFLHRDPERALRLISTKASPLQRQIVTFFEQALNDEADAGQLGHSLSMHDLAYLIVRVMESFLYSDLITREQPDAGKVRSAVAALLGCPDL